MPAPQTTYSFKDLVAFITNVLLGGPIQLGGGNLGVGSLTIRMLTQRTEHDTAADGVVMPSYLAGNSAEVTIEMQQTSALHHTLLDLYNLLTTAADNGDVSAWASTSFSARTVLDGSGHFMQGVSFQKIPDKPYTARGGKVTWTLMAADCVNQ